MAANDLNKLTEVTLDGLSRPVLLPSVIATRLQEYFPSWAFRTGEISGARPCASILPDQGRLRVAAPGQDAPRHHSTEVNAICDIIAGLPYALADEDPDRLNLHAAGIEVDGRLVLLPAVRKSGKSLMSLALAARGGRLFSDDVVGVAARHGERLVGLASGIAPRLRLPLPESISNNLRSFINDLGGPENSQYRYPQLPDLPAFGTAAPFGLVVILDRQEAGAARLAPSSRADVLKRLLHQNFRRDRDSPSVMAALYALAERTPAFTLTYSDPDEGADLIVGKARSLPGSNPPVVNVRPVDGLVHSPEKIDRSRPFSRRSSADIRELDGEYFAVSADGVRIVHMDTGAMQVWTLLEDPLSADEAAEILSTAFPDADAKAIGADMVSLFDRLARLGLINEAERPSCL